jgi:hypothetical protein
LVSVLREIAGGSLPAPINSPKRWFLISGSLGIVVALVLMRVSSNHVLSLGLLLTLWPSSIVGLADPTTLSDKIRIAVGELGGNFLWYGVVGLVIGFAVRLVGSALCEDHAHQ